MVVYVAADMVGGPECATLVPSVIQYPRISVKFYSKLLSLSIDIGELHRLHQGPAQHASVSPHGATTKAKGIAIVSNHDDGGVDDDVKTPSAPRHTSARLPDLASPHMEDRTEPCR